MKTLPEYIQIQIEEREDFNNRARKVIATSRNEHQDLRDFSSNTRSAEKTLNEMLMNLEVIVIFKGINDACTEADIEKILVTFKTKINMLEKQIEDLENLRADMRKAKMYNDEQKTLLNHKLRSVYDVKQLHVQAHSDIDGIIDYLPN